jgi:nicotinamide phosphoribosyltransferase
MANKTLRLTDSAMSSILFNTDSYKVSMWKQYPPGAEMVYSYIESRGGHYDSILFFGLQSFIKNYIDRPITQDEIDLADVFWTAHGEPFNRAGWEYILKEHGGFLPVLIRAVPEGTLVPTKNVLATIENTDPAVPWLTTWVETALLRAIWYPSTVATNSYEIKKTIRAALEKSGDVTGLPFKLHDFGARGTTSLETASLGAAAHLLNFKGTDTYIGVLRAIKDYEASFDAVGFSIPAAEHSTITSWGEEREFSEDGPYDNMVNQFAKQGAIYAVVSDSTNIFKAVDYWCSPRMVEKVKASGAILVIRPDSGDPVAVLRELIWRVEGAYGSVKNDKGYKVLNNVRFIWGDGINHLTVETILMHFLANGYSADNIAFGMGGALLQAPQRDDQKWAMKASSIRINGEWFGFSKNPVTDPGKVSKKGRVTLYKNREGEYFSGVQDWPKDELVTYYEKTAEDEKGRFNVNVRNEKWGAIVDRASQY